MKISIGCDHGGFALKEQVKIFLQEKIASRPKICYDIEKKLKKQNR